MNPNTSINPVRQTLIYTFTAVGLFLLIFIGAKAVAGADDRKYVDGQRQQNPNTSPVGSLNRPVWDLSRVIAPGGYKYQAPVSPSEKSSTNIKNNAESEATKNDSVKSQLEPSAEIIPTPQPLDVVPNREINPKPARY